MKEARSALHQLNHHPDFPIDGQVSVIRLTDEQEKSDQSGTSYLECFKGTNRRRTEIAIVLYLTQQLTGSNMMFFATKVYRKAGISESSAFDLTLAQYTMGIIGVIGSWFLIKQVGRRSLWLCGLSIQLVLLVVIGILGFFLEKSVVVPWTIGSLLILFTTFYDLMVGPLTYCLVSEIPSTRLKAKTIVIARSCYNVVGVFNIFIGPKMLEDKPDGWGFGPKAGLFWAIFCAIMIVWAYFRLPETKGRSYAELDVLFQRKVPARQFATADAGSGHDGLTPEEDKRGSVSSWLSNLRDGQRKRR
jgi:MFS transporter, SP family, general alpha glucoside:H+ symporter